MTRRMLWLLPLLVAFHLLTGASTARAQDGDHRAGLVIRFADGSVQTRCVSFSEPSITGAELLARSGLQIVTDHTSGIGGAVCSIAGAGCTFPAQDCFCRCQGLTCEYWAYYHWADGWQYSQVGAGSYTLADGALEGWSWGAGDFSSGIEPPLLTFAEVCPTLAAAAPTATSFTVTSQDIAASPHPTCAAQVAVTSNTSIHASIPPGSTATRTPANHAFATPFLIAYVQSADASGSRSGGLAQNLAGFAASKSEAPERGFNRALLPGYAAYVIALAGLAAVGAWVVRRKAAATARRS